jgi:hypothetical protein
MQLMHRIKPKGAEVTDFSELVFQDIEGALPDGTQYGLKIPKNWNGTLIRDLDLVARWPTAFGALYRDALKRGMAVCGTARHPLRMYQYDPQREIANLDRVLDHFVAQFGQPQRTVQFGCSGAGHLALAIAEDHWERIDGSVALAAHTPVWLMNSFLDGWFALKTLLTDDYVASGRGVAEDLQIVGLPNDGTANANAHGRGGKLPADWRSAIDIAQASALGRARIALAFALGQWPAWVTDDVAEPDLEDVPMLQRAMYHAVHHNAANPGGEARVMFENAAQGQQPSWNDDMDYRAAFTTANPFIRTAVSKLYADAASSLEADLERVQEAPRLPPSQHAQEFWAGKGRTTRGKPMRPVVRLHMIGDYQIPVSLVQGYQAEIDSNDRTNMFRAAYVRATGHCNFAVPESAAAIDLLLNRIESGVWDDTDATSLNARAARLTDGDEARFVAGEPYMQIRYNRIWHPSIDPGCCTDCGGEGA